MAHSDDRSDPEDREERPDGGRSSIRPFGLLVLGLNAVGTIGIFMLMVLINSDVLGRSLFNQPISGVPEMVSLSIVGIVFLQLPHTLRVGRITRSDALLRLLDRWAPRLRSGLEVIFDLIGAALVGVVVFATYPMFVKAWDRDVFIGAEGDFTAPVWPVKLVILIGSAAMAVQFLLGALNNLRRMRAGGVPR